MDKSWMSADRTQKAYSDGVAAFLKYAVSNLKKKRIPCPCVNCLNHYSLPSDEVDHHLFSKGIDPNYTTWNRHGEKDEPASSVFHTELPTNFSNMESATDDAKETKEAVEATEGDVTDPDKYMELIADAEKPLYEGCDEFTKLSAILQLLNLKSKHGISDKYYSELLPLVKRMLPKENELVKTVYEGKKVLNAMGSGYKKIHVCANDCILYRNENENLTSCPTCGKSRWKVDERTNTMYETVPAKVMWYFPIIPRLKRLFKSVGTAKDLIWHSTTTKEPGVLRHPSDSPAWQAIDDRFPEIANDPRNLRLGICTDGVDVNRGNRNHSVWPVLSVIYNLPPWLCMKRKFIMLSLLISGAPGNDIDVFLAPLIDDLVVLFEEGVKTFDAYAKQLFTLRAVVLWTINDYPALGTLCGCPYSGFHGCVVCRKKTHCRRLQHSKKQSYAGHRRYLPYNHPFRKQTKGFNGMQELETVADPMTGEEIYNELIYVRNKWGKGFKCKESELQETSTGRGGKITTKRKRNTSNDENTNSEQPYWKKFNIWFRKLRYWKYNSVHHCIDFMHIEKNVAESIVGTLLNIPGKTKDGLNARLDLEVLGIKQELQAKKTDNKTILPAASYTLTTEEKDKFCETLYNLRAPQGYCSNFSSLVSRKDRKLLGLKSHDYHMLMQQFMPIAIRSIMPEPTRNAIIRLCFFFKAICSKEIKIDELDKLQEELCVTLCLLEKYFPPSFFDVMVHLVVHLTREVKLCGPICFRWMYPFERCMKVIKGHVRNKTYPEGCIAEQTVAEETMEFISEFQRSIKTGGIPTDKHNSYPEGFPLSAPKVVEVDPELFLQAHFYVLRNTPEIEPYIGEHKTFLENTFVDKGPAWLEKQHSTTFGQWLRNKVETELRLSKEGISETVKWISNGANRNVTIHDVYVINGYTFRTKSREGRVYQNSGVCVQANDMYINSNGEVSYGQNFYYGVLKEIWVLDYRSIKIPLFMCDWVDNRHGVKRDNLGYTTVELKRRGHTNDPFIFASQARQVFYVQDQLDKKKSIVLMTPPRNYKDSYEDVDEDFSTVIFPHNDNVLPRVNQLDLGKESRNDYYRNDCKGTVIRPQC